MRKRIVAIAMIFVLSSLFGSFVWVEAASRTRVYGKVIDSATGQPIYNAKVVFHGIEQQLESRAWTDSSGNYEAKPDVYTWTSYQAFSFCDRPSTPGFDYIPALRQVFVAEDPPQRFVHPPAWSLYIRGRGFRVLRVSSHETGQLHRYRSIWAFK